MKLHYMTEGKGIVTLALKDKLCKEKKKSSQCLIFFPLSAKVMEQDHLFFGKHGDVSVFFVLVHQLIAAFCAQDLLVKYFAPGYTPSMNNINCKYELGALYL